MAMAVPAIGGLVMMGLGAKWLRNQSVPAAERNDHDVPAHLRSIPRCPDLNQGMANMASVLQLLTVISMQSMLELLPDTDKADELLLQHYKDILAVCGPLQLTDSHMNPTWNKTYGPGGAFWRGPDPDGRDRGDVPYVCPSGWMRFSLMVCNDDEFENKFKGWGYLYHGTRENL